MENYIKTVQVLIINSVITVDSSTQDTKGRVENMETVMEDLEDTLWQLDRSWENNLVFLVDEDMEGNEEIIRKILRKDLGIVREVPLINIKIRRKPGFKVLNVTFGRYTDKEEVLR